MIYKINNHNFSHYADFLMQKLFLSKSVDVIHIVHIQLLFNGRVDYNYEYYNITTVTPLYVYFLKKKKGQ